MKIIRKFSLTLDDEQVVEMPCGSNILKVGTQFSSKEDLTKPTSLITIWALCPTESDPVKRTFKLVATGVEFNDEKYIYLETVIFRVGNFVIHVFEKK